MSFGFSVVRNKWVRVGVAVLALVMFVIYPEYVLGWAADVSTRLTETAGELIPELVQSLFDGRRS